MSSRASRRHRDLREVDRLTLDWVIDKAAQFILFVSGISAIIFILSIIVFVFEQGLGFLLHEVDIVEFLTSPYWDPTDDEDPTYGIHDRAVLTAGALYLLRMFAITGFYHRYFSFGFDGGREWQVAHALLERA